MFDELACARGVNAPIISTNLSTFGREGAYDLAICFGNFDYIRMRHSRPKVETELVEEQTSLLDPCAAVKAWPVWSLLRRAETDSR